MSAGSNAFSTDDTIVAIATPPGRGAIGTVRLSGPQALRISTAMLDTAPVLEPRYATLARVLGHENRPGDEVVVTWFKAPRSYTGEDVVEISGHGSPVLLEAILHAAHRAGARLARPGEFTLRAYLNGKRDLIQAEAVGDLIAAVTPLQARVAFDQLQGTLTARIVEIDRSLFDLIARLEASLDFPDEGYHFVNADTSASELEVVVSALEQLLADGRRGRMIREGAHVTISGRTNTGKSSIFNYLSGSDRAIVTDIEGTTRDLLTENVDIGGLSVLLVDTAGARSSSDVVEVEGIRRAAEARRVADLVVLVLDRSEPLRDEDVRLLEETRDHRRLIVGNKSDLSPAFESLPGGESFVTASAQTGQGMNEVRAAITGLLTGEGGASEPVVVSNARHLSLMDEARSHLLAARHAINTRTPEEFVLSDLQAARARFDEVVGTRTSSDVLAHIFERFCIGK